MLARDNGAGQGVPAGSPIVTKSIYLVDISKATNIAGTAFETAPNGRCRPVACSIRRSRRRARSNSSTC